MRSINVTAIARPTCTHSIEPIAIRAPVRAWLVVTSALNGKATVRVHVIYRTYRSAIMNGEWLLPAFT